MTYDFSPRPRGFNTPTARASFDSIADMLRGRALEVCRRLLPAGRLNGDEWECGNLFGDKGRSLKVNVKSCVWKDFESGDGGHDLIALWAAVKGVKMGEAKAEAEAWLGVGPEEITRQTSNSNRLTAKTPPEEITPLDQAIDATDDDWWRRVPPTKVWTYAGADGQLFGRVYRFDDPTGRHKKEIRPWNGLHWLAPEGPRPLYNLPAVLAAPADATIVLVEGEKCADAINALGDPKLVGTTIWGGAAAARMTDWSTLAGKNVLRWADNDHPNGDKPTGRDTWLKTTLEHIAKAGPAALRDVPLPDSMPDGWDAADASPDERLALLAAGRQAAPVMECAPRVFIKDMTAEKLFRHKAPPEREWLIENLIEYGRGGILAAPGDTGKGMLMVDLAVKVATAKSPGFDTNPPMAFGHVVSRRGAVVLLSAEDDMAELHRRLRVHEAQSGDSFHRIHVWPYPDMPGRSPVFITGEAGKIATTPEMEDVISQLRAVPDLALVVIDPLSSFAGVDLSAPAVGQIVGNILDKLAKDLNCTVIAPHHLTKGSNDHPIKTVADARRAVLGAGQLLNAVRFVYALWAPGEDHQERVLTAVGRPMANNAVFKGAIVKANSNASREIETFVRNEATGRLEVIPYKRMMAENMGDIGVPHDIATMVVHSIRHFSSQCKLPKKTWLYRAGKGNTGQWFPYMPEPWRNLPARSLQDTLDNMQNAGLIMATDHGFLHVPDDRFHLKDGAPPPLTEDDILAGPPTPVPWPIAE